MLRRRASPAKPVLIHTGRIEKDLPVIRLRAHQFIEGKQKLEDRGTGGVACSQERSRCVTRGMLPLDLEGVVDPDWTQKHRELGPQ